MHKRKSAQAETTRSAGTFDGSHRLFIPAGWQFNQERYDALEAWLESHPGALQKALDKVDTLKFNDRGYCSTPAVQSLFIDAGLGGFPNHVTYLKWRLVFERPHLHLFRFHKPPVRRCPHCHKQL